MNSAIFIKKLDQEAWNPNDAVYQLSPPYSLKVHGGREVSVDHVVVSHISDREGKYTYVSISSPQGWTSNTVARKNGLVPHENILADLSYEVTNAIV